MTSFEEIKSKWADQKSPETPNNGHKIIIEKVIAIRKKQKLTNLILTSTIMVLIAFFIYITAYKNALVAWSLVIMITTLVIRIVLELFSIQKLNHLNVITDVSSFKQSLVCYYKNRVNVHFIWTPLLITVYIACFVILLPLFKENLSRGFYNYILISAIVILLVLGILILTQIKKELATLKDLKD